MLSITPGCGQRLQPRRRAWRERVRAHHPWRGGLGYLVFTTDDFTMDAAAARVPTRFRLARF